MCLFNFGFELWQNISNMRNIRTEVLVVHICMRHARKINKEKNII